MVKLLNLYRSTTMEFRSKSLIKCHCDTGVAVDGTIGSVSGEGSSDSSEGWNVNSKSPIKFAARKEFNHLRQFLAGRKQANPQETIQAPDVVLRESASKDREIVGRSLFHIDFERGPLGDGIKY
nr:argonaute/Dicer protein, PAZ [Tanacetum cinerariifolium]